MIPIGQPERPTILEFKAGSHQRGPCPSLPHAKGLAPHSVQMPWMSYKTPSLSTSSPTTFFLIKLQSKSISTKEKMGIVEIEGLVGRIKEKVVRSLGRKQAGKRRPYVKMDKSSSVRVEIRSRHARKLIDKTLRAADRPGNIGALS